MLKRVELKISGKVQGVFFRQNTKDIADSLNLKGFVKNDSEGTVTVIAEGEEQNLKKLSNFCKKGTPYSKVDKTITNWKTPQKKFTSFEIKF